MYLVWDRGRGWYAWRLLDVLMHHHNAGRALAALRGPTGVTGRAGVSTPARACWRAGAAHQHARARTHTIVLGSAAAPAPACEARASHNSLAHTGTVPYRAACRAR